MMRVFCIVVASYIKLYSQSMHKCHHDFVTVMHDLLYYIYIASRVDLCQPQYVELHSTGGK